MGFPADFTWGAASSAYQIEGAAAEDGKGRSVWDAFCEVPGNVAGRHHGLVACDHYHRFREDVRMMKDLGVRAYRFSICWPRVIPDGRGAVNPAGIGFYDRLVDELLEHGIEPWATLFHWDFPEALMSAGGWLNRESADCFADYAAVIAHRLSDRVRHWMTLNEPQCFIGFGHCTGTNAPGLKLSHAECLQAGHHVLLAHGKAVQALRSFCVVPPVIGWAPVGVVSMPASDDPRDIKAARNSMFSVHGGDSRNMGMHANLWSNTWWGDPVVFGTYPEDGILAAADVMPVIEAGDMEIISQPIDFYGTNIYTGAIYREGLDGNPSFVPHPDGGPLSAFKWPITPPSLRWGPRFLHERYQLPVIVTENGVSLADWVSLDGAVHDPQRVDFMQRYLVELEAAIADGADIRGYFHWSVMDNFEWAEGYRQRFGLVHVDYETHTRTPKDSAFWYRDFIRRQSGQRH